MVITRKGGKVVTIPLAPRTARAIDLAVGERVDGPIFCGPDGQRLDRHGAARVVRRVAHRAGITKPVGPHTLRHAFSSGWLLAGAELACACWKGRCGKLACALQAAPGGPAMAGSCLSLALGRQGPLSGLGRSFIVAARREPEPAVAPVVSGKGGQLNRRSRPVR